MTILVMQNGKPIGTLTAADPDVALARKLGEALQRMYGQGWQVIEVEPHDFDTSVGGRGLAQRTAG
jgi:hypothetical protein